MQEDINFLRNKKNEGTNSIQDNYVLLQKQLTPIARTISCRAVLFLHQLFLNIINGDEISEIFSNWIYQIKNPVAGPVCSKVINKKQNGIIYKCFDCMQSENACICQECFAKGDHQGHNYIHQQTDNAVCDCGYQQVWNPKSFCPAHRKGGQLKEEIQPSTKKQFIEEYTLAFYIFFALNQFDVQNTIKQSYGTKLISSLIQNVSKNYQMKILGYELLEVSFSDEYPPLNQNNLLTILQKIFRATYLSNLEQFTQLLFQIFPVKQSRIKIIKEYFLKIKNIELTPQHPLSNIDFQYMTCAKILSKLIKNKELQPLTLDKNKCPKNVKYLPFIFCQYYSNLDYIQKMKSAKQYNVLHLQMVNVAQMAFYRQQYGRLKSSYDSSNLNIDQFYLIELGYMVKNVINEKQILLKCIKELFQYIENKDVNIFSQAQERALAMFTIAFFDGDISQLFQKQIRQKFVQNLQIGKQKFPKLLKYLIKTSLKSCLLYGILPPSKAQAFIESFLKKSDKNFNYFLDVVYHKILMVISIDYFEYDKVIYQMYMELAELIKERRDQNISFIMYKEWPEIYKILNIYKINMEGYQTIKRAVKFLNTLTIVNLDEIVISNFLKINEKQQKQKVYDFYTRLLSSFKQLNIKQFKALAISIINNEQAFEQFIRDRTIIFKGKLISKVESKPLETYSYNYLFESYDKSIQQTEVCLLTQVGDRGKYSAINIFNNSTITLLKQVCTNILEQFSFISQFANISNSLFSELSLELFQIYFYNREQSLKQYFHGLMNPDIRKIISTDLTKQIAIVEKEKEKQYETETEKIKNQKEASDKKKRQKMVNMRREKADIIRKKQENFLMSLQDNTEQQSQPQLSNCIYCKQTKQQELNFISYVNFTGLVEKGILKDSVYPQSHLFFTTCGHKIHQSCYRSVSENSPSKFCFLCKRETNILVPQLSLLNNISLLQKQTKIKDFLSNIVPILIGDLSSSNNQVYTNLINQISSDQDTFIYFVYGFARELVYTALQNYKYFHKSQFHLYYQIFQMIRCRPKTIIESAFSKINELYHKNIIYLENKLNSLQRYIMVLLETSLLMKIDDTDHKFLGNLSQLQIQQAQKIVSLFTGEKPSSELSSITNLNMVSPNNLFIAIPEHLNELIQKMGQCPLCPNITNKIYMCMLCGWSACIKCQLMLYKHSSTDHIGGSVFIVCSNGEIIFFYGNNVFQETSIYQNYLGTSYMQTTSLEEMSKLYKLQKFNLNHQKLEEIYKIILMYGIHKKIFSKN